MGKKLKITELNRLTAEEFRQSDKLPLAVVLDNVRSLHNVGSVFRTADAFRAERLYLCGITSTPPNAELHKTALGAEFSVPWTYRERTLDAIAELRQSGYTLLCVEQAENSILLNDMQLSPTEKYALVLGNEVKGVEQSVVNACDQCVEIPQFGTKHSLNVSVAGGIAIWECFRLFSLFNTKICFKTRLKFP